VVAMELETLVPYTNFPRGFPRQRTSFAVREYKAKVKPKTGTHVRGRGTLQQDAEVVHCGVGCRAAAGCSLGSRTGVHRSAQTAQKRRRMTTAITRCSDSKIEITTYCGQECEKPAQNRPKSFRRPILHKRGGEGPTTTARSFALTSGAPDDRLSGDRAIG
jgi:hypothetical protein